MLTHLRGQHLDGKQDLALVFGELGERVHGLALRILAKLREHHVLERRWRQFFGVIQQLSALGDIHEIVAREPDWLRQSQPSKPDVELFQVNPA
jgi:hypothetical protein